MSGLRFEAWEAVDIRVPLPGAHQNQRVALLIVHPVYQFQMSERARDLPTPDESAPRTHRAAVRAGRAAAPPGGRSRTSRPRPSGGRGRAAGPAERVRAVRPRSAQGCVSPCARDDELHEGDLHDEPAAQEGDNHRTCLAAGERAAPPRLSVPSQPHHAQPHQPRAHRQRVADVVVRHQGPEEQVRPRPAVQQLQQELAAVVPLRPEARPQREEREQRQRQVRRAAPAADTSRLRATGSPSRLDFGAKRYAASLRTVSTKRIPADLLRHCDAPTARTQPPPPGTPADAASRGAPQLAAPGQKRNHGEVEERRGGPLRQRAGRRRRGAQQAPTPARSSAPARDGTARAPPSPSPTSVMSISALGTLSSHSTDVGSSSAARARRVRRAPRRKRK